jgi:glutamate synthase domain-containing protein 1
MSDAKRLATHYVALWNEKNEFLRREGIASLWRSDASHFVGTRAIQGLKALDTRIAESHEKNVRDGGYVFRAVDDAQALHDAVTFHWEMVPAAGGEVVARGLEFVVVDTDGRIAADYQFNLATR